MDMYKTKTCYVCRKLTQVKTDEQKEQLSKGNFESSEYIKLEKFLFIDIEHCSHCWHCNLDIESEVNAKILNSQKYKSLTEFFKFEENKNNINHILLTGAYVLTEMGDYYNSAKAYLKVARNLSGETFKQAKISLTKSQFEKYEQVFAYYEKVREYCLNTATDLVSNYYAKSSDFNALLLLLFILKESNQTEQYNTLSELIFTLPLTEEQTELANIITEQNQ